MSSEFSIFLHAGYAVRGELDTTNSADAMLAIAALTARCQVVIVELSGLEFMDCSALGALLTVQKLGRQGGGDVLMAAPVAMVLRLLSFTGADEAFGVYASVGAAVASIDGRSWAGASRRPEPAGCPGMAAAVLSGSSA
jgi:anti-sigma B factor antagonist